MNTTREISLLREQALNLAEAESTDADEILMLEANIFEGLLGNWLLANPEYIPFFKDDEGWREEYEDLLPIEWEEFMASVEASVA